MSAAHHPDAMVVLAIVVSRPEALVVASMLEAGGVCVRIGGEYYASDDLFSVTLGGYRLWVPTSQYGHASALVREVGLCDFAVSSDGARKSVLALVLAWVGAHVFFVVPALIAGWITLIMATMFPLSVLGLPVDPRGKPDFFLMAEVE